MHAGGQNFAYDPSDTSILKMQPQPTTTTTTTTTNTRTRKQSSTTPPSSSTPSLQESPSESLSKTPTTSTASSTSTLAEKEGRNGRKDSLDSSASSVTSTIKPNEKDYGEKEERLEEGRSEGKEAKKSISAFIKKTKEGLRRTFAFPEEEEGEFKAYPESFRASGRM